MRKLALILALVLLIGMTGCTGTETEEPTAAETVFQQGDIHGNRGSGEEHQHVYYTTTVQATCRTEGYTQYTCSICGDSYRGETVPAGKHNYSVNVVKAEDGSGYKKIYTCQICGYSYTETDTRSGN